MLIRYIKNDLSASKMTSFVLFLFTTLAALFVAAALMTGTLLIHGIDSLMEKAKTPHFLQMHIGDLDEMRLQNFASSNEMVEAYQLIKFLNIDAGDILAHTSSFTDSAQDNGFCIQSEGFDYLFDLDFNIVHPKEGTVYVPVFYRETAGIKQGETITIGRVDLTVAGFIRDSQMNQALTSSKRFIINQADFDKLSPIGNLEYLIEFRLKDQTDIRLFEQSYSSAGLEANGPQITYPMIRLINAISDSLLVVVAVLNSLFLMGIIFMCVRFTILTSLEEDYREIGIMKGIGLKFRDISRIYYSKYLLLTFLGCIIGFLTSIIMQPMVVSRILVYTGVQPVAVSSIIRGALGAFVVFFSVFIYIRSTLQTIKTMQPALALSGNTFRAQTPNGNPVPLFSRIRNMNLSLGISMLLSRKKSFFSFFLVFVFLSFVAIVPMNLSHTIEDPGFMRYMGMGPCDIVIRLQQSEEMEDRLKDMENLVSSDPDVDSYSILSTGTYTVLSTDGSTEHLKIETGDHSIFPVAYLEGSLPREVNEVALSKLNADEMGRSVGDTLFLINADGSRITLKVCGVYSDITNGGKTAKAAYIESVSHIMWTVMSVSLKSGAGSEAKAATWQAAYSGVKVIDSRQYFSQTLGSTVYNLKMASIIAASVSVLITALSVSLFLRLLLAKDRYEIAILKSLGFRHRDIKTQYTLCFGAVATTGVGVGALLACTLGKEASGLILTGLGIFDFTFVIDKFNAFLFLPLSIILVTVCTSVLRAESLKRVTVADGIKE